MGIHHYIYFQLTSILNRLARDKLHNNRGSQMSDIKNMKHNITTNSSNFVLYNFNCINNDTIYILLILNRKCDHKLEYWYQLVTYGYYIRLNTATG